MSGLPMPEVKIHGLWALEVTLKLRLPERIQTKSEQT